MTNAEKAKIIYTRHNTAKHVQQEQTLLPLVQRDYFKNTYSYTIINSICGMIKHVNMTSV